MTPDDATYQAPLTGSPPQARAPHLQAGIDPVIGLHKGFHTGASWAIPLPTDQTCASVARSRLHPALSELGLGKDLLADAELMTSEIATNALLHGLNDHRCHSHDGAFLTDHDTLEMWIHPRLYPTSDLIIGIFDPWPAWDPYKHGTDGPLAEHGRGVDIMNALGFAWGWHLSRSRLARTPCSGKATWFAVPLTDPGIRPAALNLTIAQAAQALHRLLTARGLPGVRLEHGHGRWLLSLASGPTIWVEPPNVFRWPDGPGSHTTRPINDLTDMAETAVRLHEEAAQRLSTNARGDI